MMIELRVLIRDSSVSRDQAIGKLINPWQAGKVVR